MKRISIATAILATAISGCGNSGSGDPLVGVNSILILQRPERAAGGDIFDYASYVPGARIIELSPPTADGEIKVICCDQDANFAQADISGYDLSFDATEIVFSAKLSADQSYGLFLLAVDSGVITQLPTDPSRDYIMPVFLPGDRIVYMTNNTVDSDLDGALDTQHRDEYERRTTVQLGVISRDGSEETLGPRNLSHRVFPTVLSDGRLMFTQWDHLDNMNAGHLVIANPDMTTVREAFGKEGGVTNSYTKAVEVSPGRVVAIGSSRDRTLQSGAILDIRLGQTRVEGDTLLADQNMSEANSSFRILTPNVPLDREPSSQGIGRYYDAYPLNKGEDLNLLVSWANGPVESGTLEAAGLTANFGVYLYDAKNNARRPILDTEGVWDIFPRPFASRPAPPEIAPSGSHEYGRAALIGGMNVYDSTIFNFEPGSAVAVRMREGFSGEEGGIGRDFGLTESEGAAVLGMAPVHSDGSFAATVPAGVPIMQQVIDKFGMAMGSEPIWISGAPGESRLCGGCHEDRAGSTVIDPGITEAFAYGPKDLLSQVVRNQRTSQDFSDYVGTGGVVGVPWSTSLQAIFDNKCVSCHNGTPGAANPSYTVTDPTTGDSFTWTFDLRGDYVPNNPIGEILVAGYSASHLSIMGPDMMELEDAGLEIVGELPIYIEPRSARDSKLIEKLNPPQLFRYDEIAGDVVDAYDPNVRAFAGPIHGDQQGFTLTPQEYYLLILAADNGGQYFSRENAPGGL